MLRRVGPRTTMASLDGEAEGAVAGRTAAEGDARGAAEAAIVPGLSPCPPVQPAITTSAERVAAAALVDAVLTRPRWRR